MQIIILEQPQKEIKTNTGFIFKSSINIYALIADILALSGFKVKLVSSWKDLKKCINKDTEFVLLEIDSIRKNNYAILKDIAEKAVNKISVIVLKNNDDKLEDKLELLKNGVENFIDKPMSPEEIIFILRNKRDLTIIAADKNPLTKLPGNNRIRVEIERRIRIPDTAILYLDLDNFKAYNDVYGFNNGDKVIKLLADIAIEAIERFDSNNGFVGHVGGDDFVVITSYNKIEKICTFIIQKFDKDVKLCYNKDDLERGYILAKDREGKEKCFGLVSVSIAVVSNHHRELYNATHVAKIAAEVKKKVKSINGSCFYIDQRRSDRD